MTDEQKDVYMNGEDYHDIIPVRRTTLDDILEGIHECRTGLSRLTVHVDERFDRFRSDISELRGGNREARGSVANLEKVLADERLAETKASRDRWRNWIIGIATSILVLIVGAVIGRVTK